MLQLATINLWKKKDGHTFCPHTNSVEREDYHHQVQGLQFVFVIGIEDGNKTKC
jgi:hypothetical protein